jgi:hypothetical protein
MDDIVRSFAQQVNPEADFYCKVAKQSFGLVLSALGRICGKAASAKDEVVAFGAVGRRSLHKRGQSGKDCLEVVNFVKNVNKVATIVHSMSIEVHKFQNPKSTGEILNGFEVHLTPKYATNWCSAFGGGREDKNDKHIQGLRTHVSRVLYDFRRVIFETSSMMATSDEFDEWIETPLYESSSKVMNAEKIEYEE